MSSEEFSAAKEIIWDNEVGHLVTTNEQLSHDLSEALSSVGVVVKKVGRKPRSKNPFILFTIEVQRVKGIDLTFLTEEDAKRWHSSKNRNLNTLMKAPDEAFRELEVETVEEMIWWNQAFCLAHRLGAGMGSISEKILKYKAIIQLKMKKGVNPVLDMAQDL
jgi:hypothetical protein